MCGFAGAVALAPGARVDPGSVLASARRLAHRGPDDEGSWADDHAAFGFRRLAILDPSPAGHQPMSTADGRHTLVFNGEIYNFRELAQELEADGVPLRTGSDTEVLLHLLVRDGEATLARLRGMWAFALWDATARRLLAARDPFGIKPLYHRRAGDVLHLGSEVKALAPPQPLVEPDALTVYLALQFVPAPATMTAGVRMLEPGHLLWAGPGEEPRIEAYDRPRPGPSARRSAPEAPVLDALRESVRLHLRSDVPVGAFLSGGIDSAAVCALAAEERPGLDVFSIGFEGSTVDELPRAEAIADELGLRCHPRVVTEEEFIAALPQIAWHFDDPVADASAVAIWFLAREARRRVKVVLSGEGADELFGGYQHYARGLQPGPGENAAAGHVGVHHLFGDDEIGDLAVHGTMRARDVVAPLHHEAAAAALDGVATMQLVDLRTWLPGDILAKADRMTMAHGLELRVPFLDRAVFAAAVPLTPLDKIANGTTKHVLRRAVAGLVPLEVAVRPKLGFPVPIAKWLRGDLGDYAATVFEQSDVSMHVDPGAGLRLLRRHRTTEDYDWRRVWALLTFCLWHRYHVEGRYGW